MFKSSEGCQRYVVGDRLVALTAAGQKADRSPSASLLVGAALGSRL